eukprot:766427-Hanusia_phi.AAC.2
MMISVEEEEEEVVVVVGGYVDGDDDGVDDDDDGAGDDDDDADEGCPRHGILTFSLWCATVQHDSDDADAVKRAGQRGMQEARSALRVLSFLLPQSLLHR